MKHLSVIGAGLSGLAAAVNALQRGYTVDIFEATGHAGGRCRSFYDETLGITIDNGQHAILAGNTYVNRFIDLIGSRNEWDIYDALPMIDLNNGMRFTQSLGRLPSYAPLEPLRIARLLLSGQNKCVYDYLGKSPHYDAFWKPLCDSILNTCPKQASSRLLADTLWQIIKMGKTGARLMIAKNNLDQALIVPAVKHLKNKGAQFHFNHKITSLPDGKVILAAPCAQAAKLVPNITFPNDYSPIINIHYKIILPPQFVGVINALTHWIWVKSDHISITISAAGAIKMPADDLARTAWGEICAALNIQHTIPEYRIITEKRATLNHTPKTERLRPNAYINDNLYLAGDYTNTALPCTIEGSVKSGLGLVF